MPSKISQLRKLSVARWLVLLNLIDSWLFVYVNGRLVFGVNGNKASCAVGIWLCLLLYGGSKMLLYAWLTERLHIVYTTRIIDEGTLPTSRLKSRAYHISVVWILLWIAVFICTVVKRVSFLRPEDGACGVRSQRFVTIPTLIVDFFVTVYLTVAFTLPVWKTNLLQARNVAIKSGIAAIAALVITCTNIIVLITLHGHELSFVCAISCGADVSLNAIIIFFITSRDANPAFADPSSFVTGLPDDKDNSAGHTFALEETSYSQPAKASIKARLSAWLSGQSPPPQEERR